MSRSKDFAGKDLEKALRLRIAAIHGKLAKAKFRDSLPWYSHSSRSYVDPEDVAAMQAELESLERQLIAISKIPENTNNSGQSSRTGAEKNLQLVADTLLLDGKQYPLQPNAAAMWRKFFEYDGGPLHQADFPGIQPRKVIHDMPGPVKKLIIHGVPHRGYEVPRLRKKQF